MRKQYASNAFKFSPYWVFTPRKGLAQYLTAKKNSVAFVFHNPLRTRPYGEMRLLLPHLNITSKNKLKHAYFARCMPYVLQNGHPFMKQSMFPLECVGFILARNDIPLYYSSLNIEPSFSVQIRSILTDGITSILQINALSHLQAQ